MFTPANDSTRLFLSNQSNEQNFLIYYILSDIPETPEGSSSAAPFSRTAREIWATLKGYFIFLSERPSNLAVFEKTLQNLFPSAPEHNSLAWVNYDETNQQVQIKDVITLQAEGQLKEGQTLSHGAIQMHLKSGTAELKDKVDLNLPEGLTESLSNVVHISYASTSLIETSQIQPLNNLYIPLSGNRPGTVLSDAVILGDLNGNSQALASLTYYFPEKNKPSNILRQDFPLGNIGSSDYSPVFQFS